MKPCCEDINRNDLTNTPKHDDSKKKGIMKWVKRFGVAGFLFFLIKGILWLTVGAAAIRYFGCS
jgi:hypothetical protein